MRRAVYFLLLIASGVLVSWRGGNIPYLLFYFFLMLPVLALVYSLYVYCRFKIIQEVERTVVKAQKVPYRLKLANEDFIPFTDISLNYYTDMVSISEWDGQAANIKEKRSFSLPPRQEICVDTKLYCKYRGTYPVGVRSVTITDFLGFFTITYPLKDQVRLTARPRIIPLLKLTDGLREKDPKNSRFPMPVYKDLPDFDVRRYQPGDTKKYIHWKNSAKAGELLVRRQTPEELFEMTVLIDLSKAEGNPEERLRTADKIMEAAVSFVHDYYMKKIPVRVVYMDGGLKELLVDAQTGFDGFYDKSANLPFQAELPAEKVLKEYLRRTAGADAVVLITASVSDGLLSLLGESGRTGREIMLVDVGELSI